MHFTKPEQLQLEKNYNDFYGVLGAASLILGIAVAAIFLLGGGMEALIGLFATLGVFWLLLITVIGLNNRRLVERERRDAESLFAGSVWAVWQWSPADWQRDLGQRRETHAKRLRFQRFMPWIGGAASLIIGGSALLPVLVSGESMPENLRAFVIGLAIFFAALAFLLSVVSANRERHKWRLRLQQAEQLAAPWICFGPYGVYHQVDGHVSLRNLGNISLSKKEQVITFYIKHPLPKGGSVLHPFPVRIPEPHLTDASTLVARYRSERGLRS
jgi:hypothetical protein